MQSSSAQQLFSHCVADLAPVSACRPLHCFSRAGGVKVPLEHMGAGGRFSIAPCRQAKSKFICGKRQKCNDGVRILVRFAKIWITRLGRTVSRIELACDV